MLTSAFVIDYWLGWIFGDGRLQQILVWSVTNRIQTRLWYVDQHFPP